MTDLFQLGELDTWPAAVGALVVGLTGSLHCFLMCGPLACAAGGAAPRARTIGAYHLARILSYTLTGALLGGLGEGAGGLLSVHLAPVAPWLLALALLAGAFELGKRLPPIPGLAQIVRRAGLSAQKLPDSARAFVLGGLTPLLPCGLLYGLFAAAAATGSPATGALLLGAFALGAIPALLAAQLHLRHLLLRPGRLAQVLRRAVPALAAAVVVYRALAVHGAHACH